ncbi:ATP-binding protein [Sphingomonas abietis]|uniref:histidine kinase n=1 Tax=Sphingomonas abietis TaxID=3012344 RepID=A0ABY7NMQ0_9SPHN|nr:ATP-binding protein [Sphingomonas abietis]WBO21928.1 ATP-binding protein [Sphingomonas abietis]
MTTMVRRRAWREPPIVFQILALLFGGLIVAQLVTLLLTLVLPPAPPVQHSMSDIVAALRQEGGLARLSRVVQSGPPDVTGGGWFTSEQSRHDLAMRMGAEDRDVRLAFYAPLPFAGITAPPSLPLVPMHPASQMPAPSPIRPLLRPIDWQVSSDPLGSRAARMMPASLLLVDQAGPPAGGGGGGFPGGGAPGGGFSGGVFPGSSFPGFGAGGGLPDRGRERGGQAGDPGFGGRGDGTRPDRAGSGSGSAPSPSDLDRQPMPSPQPVSPFGQAGGQPGGRANGTAPGAAAPQDRRGFAARPVPTEGFDPSRMPAELPPQSVERAVSDLPAHVPAVKPPAPRPVQDMPATMAPAQSRDGATAATSSSAPLAVSRRGRNTADVTANPLPIVPPSRALFGLAPAPFVEGDFVAALRQADGRWVVVQPIAAGFPNAWQRRVMLWFAIAFLLVAPLGWLFARRIVRPLARFTAAAEQLGRDPSAALVALEGPAEIGRAAHAFNVMQNRLQSFVDDRTAMVGAISHDLRTPLTRMRFRIEEVDDDAIREGMTGEVTEMEDMITSVLNFIRDASTPNVRERLDLGLLVEDVAQDAAMIGGRVTLEEIASAPVEVDVLGMRRLLANLVENAVKYGDCARIRLAVEEDAAIADIRDDGPGVPEAELERAFEPFYRASNAEASGRGGSGLGLAVCRSIARAHGGDVLLIRSEEGFSARLRLPLSYDATPIAA